MKKQNEMKINNGFRITFKTILCSVLAIVLDSRKSMFFVKMNTQQGYGEEMMIKAIEISERIR